ncbi:type II toxin-antitoxin system VapC family toxin [Caulobacter hibisci]|uniref:Ribonuclease VapC n=1 Tax=Caulobacter hibisci TaxID=2035993 RepID=A0ABS0SZK4_9CAUL|nr:type II toxin-antitoxin system VapC family toxin [Caulobacter hibisci]MBI1685058.1 type II toxin-antitoxin system VapC family toxin [Caulobacter hibisci]
MMVVDASALVAILFKEPDWEAYFEALVEADDAVISPVNAWEVHVRAHSRDGEEGRVRAETLLSQLGIVIAAIDERHLQIALEARERYGRAVLNLGDCFAYALSKTNGDGALLYKGDDFARTDLRLALKEA